jgi:hypothetical protein
VTYFIVLGIAGYSLGWLVFILANDPQDSFEGVVCLVSGVLWPLFALGWLVSR